MKTYGTILAGAMASLLTLGAAPAPTADEGTVVEITDRGYSPERIEILVGGKVIWKNGTVRDDNVTCSVKSIVPQPQDHCKVLFDSGVIAPGASFSWTFKEAGTYEYYCGHDRSMTGTVVVRSAK